MQKFYLAEIETKDKLVHQGIYFSPKKKGKTAFLWIHGLTDNFYGDLKLMEELSTYCEREGWGLASFNNRGHDIITSISKLDPSTAKGKTAVTIGSAYEKFSNCILDIDAGITFLTKQGFSKVVIAGISTGANKVCYYEGTKHDPRVIGVILASPISDPSVKMKELGKSYDAVIKKVKRIKGGVLIESYDWMPQTASRFLSLNDTGGDEDTFPYYDKNIRPQALSKVTKPLMVIMGGSDEWADRPVRDIVSWFTRTCRNQQLTSAIIPGAYHSYGGKEKEFVSQVVDWTKSL